MCKKETPWQVFLRLAYPTVHADCLGVVNKDGRRYVKYTYDQLAQMTRCETFPDGLWFGTDGNGYEAIRSHREELWDKPLCVWWMGDGVPGGLVFTACPIIGTRWYASYHANLTRIVMLRIADSSRVGGELRPSESKFFGQVEKMARGLANNAGRLLTEFSGPEDRAPTVARLEAWAKGDAA